MNDENLELIVSETAKRPIRLVTGAVGQIGSEWVPYLRKLYGDNDIVVAGWHTTKPTDELKAGPTEKVDVSDRVALEKVIVDYGIGAVDHLAGILSAKGEERPDLAWDLNMGGLVNVLELARKYDLCVFIPSSIAAFGPGLDKDNAPQEILSYHPTTIDEITRVADNLLANYHANRGTADYRHRAFWESSDVVFEPGTPMDIETQGMVLSPPTTMYGITKVIGELLIEHYAKQFGVDAVGLRYPGIVSWVTPPGGGTTDGHVQIFYDALKYGKFESFLEPDVYLPMMMMDDTLEVTHLVTTLNKIEKGKTYNVTGPSFTTAQIATEIKKYLPEFEVTYNPDFRNSTAKSWSDDVNDSELRNVLGWEHRFGLTRMVETMLMSVERKLIIEGLREN